MALDDTAREVFAMKRPPLGMLIAGRATDMLTASLADEPRARFAALATALEAWWPTKRRDPEDIYQNEYAACLDLEDGSEPMAAAMRGARLQMRGLLTAAPRTLPRDDFYELEDTDFIAALREGAKATRLPLVQCDARLKLLVAAAKKKEKWPALIERTRRMSWDRSAPWGKLDKRTRELASLADLGAVASWSKFGTQDALRLELDDVKRITVLAAEELEALRRVVPSIPELG